MHNMVNKPSLPQWLAGSPGFVAISLLVLLAGCTAKAPPPPAGAAKPLPPEPATLSAIHQGLGPEQTLWHFRSGLNVAALACQTQGGPGIVQDYNRFLALHRESLLKAHAATLARYRAEHGAQGQALLDKHMTRLYNHFAWPPAQARFCPIAAHAVKDALAVPAGELEAYAQLSLPLIDEPVAASAMVDRARSASMETAVSGRSVTVSVAPAAAQPAVLSGWRIQLGAFQGRKAAEGAWIKLRALVPVLGEYQPYYEPVPGNAKLVRLQLDGAIGRADALRICAVTAGHGQDCILVKAATA
jgi:cell division septation protein DedD